jgi:hypothetical protein
MSDLSTLKSLLERVEKAEGPDNALDIAIDIALFAPDERHVSARANAAGTKVVYERHDGGSDTYWAADHTLNAGSRNEAGNRIRALMAQKETADGK